MRPTTEIRQSIQRMACTRCGAEANASCNCGVAYVPKAVRAAEAVAANPEKSNRAIAADIGVDEKTVREARAETTADHSAVDRIGLDGKTRKRPVKKKEPLAKGDDEDRVTVDDWANLSKRTRALEAHNTALTAALNAREAEASRNWPEDMTSKQVKQRDNCLKQIAAWQRALEQLYGEVTGQPSWRVDITTKDGRRLGNGTRFGTRGEAEFYNTHFAPSERGGIGNDYASGEVLACATEKANVTIDGDVIRFAHGDCVLLEWHETTVPSPAPAPQLADDLTIPGFLQRALPASNAS